MFGQIERTAIGSIRSNNFRGAGCLTPKSVMQLARDPLPQMAESQSDGSAGWHVGRTSAKSFKIMSVSGLLYCPWLRLKPASEIGAFDAIVLQAERDGAIIGSDEPPIGDGNVMGVAREVAQHLFRPRKWWLAIGALQ